MAKDKVVVEIVTKDNTKKGIDSATKSFAKMAKTIGPLVAAGFGIAAVKAVTDAFIKQENAVTQLEQRLKSTNNAVGLTSKQLQGMADGFQNVTKFASETVLEAQSLLLTFTKIGGEVFPAATETVLNMAEALGNDLKGASIQLGKALNDPIKGVSALAEVGVSFTEGQKESIAAMVEMNDIAGAQKIILAELAVEFGGAARAAKETLAGSMATAANDAADLGAVIGGVLAPTIAELADVASFAARALREMIDPTLQGDLEAVNKEIEAMGGLLNDMAASGEAQNQLDFVEGQIDDLVDKRLELEQKIKEINDPIAQRGAATGTAGVPGSAADAANGLPPSIASFREFDAARLAEVDAAILSQQIAQGNLLTDTWQQTAMQKEAIDKRAADAKAQLLMDEVDQSLAKEKAIGDLASLMNSKNKEAFQIGKAAAIAQATISTYEGATKAYTSLAGIPVVGPGLGVAAAAAAVAAGLSNVQRIASTSFGGGGGGGGGGSTPNITTGGDVIGPVIQPQGQTAAQTGGQPIVVEGNSLLAVLVEEQLIPAMNEAMSRGVQLVIV